MKRICALLLTLQMGIFTPLVQPQEAALPTGGESKFSIECPSAILMEASTGTVIYEKNATEIRSPASITKIMTLLLAMEALEEGRVHLDDMVITSEYASSMGGSQVFLAQGEEQTFSTMLKCIAVASGNDASVAVAEHLSGSEQAFVEKMNEKATELKLEHTHFTDCSGLTNDDDHYTCALDVALMAKELITKYPEIYNYSQIWMEDILHITPRGEEKFTLSSTNKLLKQYPYTTGLKTGSTNKAKYCFCATAQKDRMDMIAVIMGAENPKERFKEAQELLTYGFSICHKYVDENHDVLPMIPVERGNKEQLEVVYQNAFSYLEIMGNKNGKLKKEIILPSKLQAPIEKGREIGVAKYTLEGKEVGEVKIIAVDTIEKANLLCCMQKIFYDFLLYE